MARRPKFKVGDLVRVTLPRFSGIYSDVGHEFTITERRYRDDFPNLGPYWYRGGATAGGFDPGIWEEYLEAVPASPGSGVADE